MNINHNLLPTVRVGMAFTNCAVSVLARFNSLDRTALLTTEEPDIIAVQF